VQDRPAPATVRIRPLPLTEKRAVGGPVAERLLLAYFSVALAAWIAAAATAVAAAPDLAHAAPLASRPVLAVHLVALGVLPFAVAGASFHLLPVMLRRDLPWPRGLWLALALLLGGPVAAVGVSRWSSGPTWVGAALVLGGLAIAAGELGWVVARAPGDRTLIASRAGVALSLLHAAVAGAVGVTVFARGGFWGVPFDRWLLVHLHLALVGWILLLVVTVGRSLAPMLAQAPAARRRRLPLDELALVAGLWLLVAGIAAASRTLSLAGAAVAAAVLARFGALLVRTYRGRRAGVDAPLGHLLAGAAFLVQAVALGVLAVFGVGGTRVVTAYVALLLGGWAAGVVVGHVPKLLSLSVWVWWPPGPRPKQGALYPRRLMLAETAAFAVGVELVAVGILAGSVAVVRAGTILLVAAAVLAGGAVAEVWRRRLEA
jgi:hypothetical protein